MNRRAAPSGGGAFCVLGSKLVGVIIRSISHKFTRRDFIKLASLSLGAAAFKTLSPNDSRLAQPLSSLGRITIAKARVLNRPNRLADTIGFVERDEVVTVHRAVVGEGFYPHNHVWIEIPQGYVYSSWVQPVKNEPQTPLATLPPDGFFAEVNVPLTEARSIADPTATLVYKLYYSTVFKIDDIATDPSGAIWYHILDDQNSNYWAIGQHLRPVTADEIAPISPNVTDKRIVADVKTNWLSAYEGKTEVFRTRIASGASFFEPDGSEHAGINAGGVYAIYTKRISRHMAGGVYPNGFDLPGIAWVSYWHAGAAIHSTYWHNDYGRPRSHGCLNCTPEAAKWLFRWTTPEVSYDPGDITVTWPGGTHVEIEGVPPPLEDDSAG